MSSASPEKRQPDGSRRTPGAAGREPGKTSAPTTAEPSCVPSTKKTRSERRRLPQLPAPVAVCGRTCALLLSLLSLVALAGLGLFRPLLMGQVVSHAAAKLPDALFRDGLLLTGLVFVTQLVTVLQMCRDAAHRRAEHGRSARTSLPSSACRCATSIARRSVAWSPVPPTMSMPS